MIVRRYRLTCRTHRFCSTSQYLDQHIGATETDAEWGEANIEKFNKVQHQYNAYIVHLRTREGKITNIVMRVQLNRFAQLFPETGEVFKIRPVIGDSRTKFHNARKSDGIWKMGEAWDGLVEIDVCPIASHFWDAASEKQRLLEESMGGKLMSSKS